MWQYICQSAICQLAVVKICQLANNTQMANRIRERRKAKGITLEELADRSGLSTSYLSRIETNNRELSLESLIRIARGLGEDPEDLSDEFGIDDIEYAKRLPVGEQPQKGDVGNLLIRAGLGLGSPEGVVPSDEGALYADQVNGYWSFPEAVKAGWRNLSQIYALPVVGDSMEPTLKSGSYVFVDMTHTVPQPEDIYACDYGDGLSIKRLQLIPRTAKIKVISDNDRYEDHVLRRDEVRVYGRVVAWFQWRG
ncbi:XRE family transcriptional regulator [Microbaculum marinum]|uniref:S24 family peptidase n=1 Tax=Microbaculum marinum TaxID=1764581 RepID=A0AAW9RQV2_9HYPH